MKSYSSTQTLRVLMVTGVYPTANNPHAGTFIKSQVESLRMAGIHVDVIHPPNGPTLLRYLSALVLVFCKTIRRHYDIVHGHYGLWCLIARCQWTTPVVASYLGDDVLGTITSKGGYSSKGNFVVHVSQKLVYWVNAVIVKSRQMEAQLNGPKHKIFVVPNGVNFEQFRPLHRDRVRTQLGWDQQRLYVLFGNDPEIPVKHFMLAKTAINILRKQGWDVELVVANGLPHDTVAYYLNASNALILSSKVEGSPNIVKEAMACNIPVVATNVGDVADVIGHTAGCSVCDHSATELAAGLERAFKYSQPTTGRNDISHLSSEKVAQHIIKIYRDVIQRRSHCTDNFMKKGL